MMTVRMLCFSFPPFGLDISDVGITGGDRRFIEVSKRLTQMRVKIGVLSTDTGAALYEREGLQNVDLYLIRLPRFLEGVFKVTARFQNLHILASYIIAPLLALLKIPRLREYNVVYSQSDFLSDTMLALFCKTILRMRWAAITYHIIPNPFQRKGKLIINILSFISQQISWFSVRKADLVMVCETEEGRRIKQKLVKRGVKEQRIVMVQVGVDLNRISNITTNSQKEYDACFAAALGPVRGLFDIVPVWEKVVRLKKHAKLVVIGKGAPEHEQAFIEQVERSGLQDNIEIAGYLTHDPLFMKMKKSKLFINLYHETGWALAITEAMACGLPVVAYDLPSYNIYRKGMIKVPLLDFDVFAKAVVELIGDDYKRTKLAREAENMALDYDILKISKNELDLLRKILQ